MDREAVKTNSSRNRQGRCAACGKRFNRWDRRVRVTGAVFHRRCAVYEPRATRAAHPSH